MIIWEKYVPENTDREAVRTSEAEKLPVMQKSELPGTAGTVGIARKADAESRSLNYQES